MTLFCPPFLGVTTEADDGGRNPVPNARAFFYLTGTTTLRDVYSDVARTVARTNPVVADAEGIFPTTYLAKGVLYRVVITGEDEDTGSPLYAYDGVGDDSAVSDPVDATSGASYTVLTSDRGRTKKRTHSAALTCVLPAASSAGNGWFTTLWNASAYAMTVTVASSGLINGSSSLVLQAGERARLQSDGSSYTCPEQPLTKGLREYTLPAAAWKETATNGCAAIARGETSTNKVNYDYLAFDQSTDEYAYAVIKLPPSYLAGSLKYRVIWTSAGGTAAQTMSWSLAGRCYADFTDLDAAYGTAAEAADALLAVGYIHVTGFSNIAPANDAADRILMLRLKRNTASDTLASDALMVAVVLQWSLSSPTDA